MVFFFVNLEYHFDVLKACCTVPMWPPQKNRFKCEVPRSAVKIFWQRSYFKTLPFILALLGCMFPSGSVCV